MEEALKVKVAFGLGVQRLLKAAGLSSTALARVCLASALGLHATTGALENIGFFPPGMGARITAVGNSSLAGSVLLVRNPVAREALVRWSTAVEPLNLAADPNFAQRFASHMRFAW